MILGHIRDGTLGHIRGDFCTPGTAFNAGFGSGTFGTFSGTLWHIGVIFGPRFCGPGAPVLKEKCSKTVQNFLRFREHFNGKNWTTSRVRSFLARRGLRESLSPRRSKNNSAQTKLDKWNIWNFFGHILVHFFTHAFLKVKIGHASRKIIFGKPRAQGLP